MKSTDSSRGTELQPGDLCRIVRPSYTPVPRDDVLRYVGRTVILIEHHHLANQVGGWAPYWRCSGLPPECAVSHIVLKKIPPDQMLDARMHAEPVEDGVTGTITC